MNGSPSDQTGWKLKSEPTRAHCLLARAGCHTRPARSYFEASIRRWPAGRNAPRQVVVCARWIPTGLLNESVVIIITAAAAIIIIIVGRAADLKPPDLNRNRRATCGCQKG